MKLIEVWTWSPIEDDKVACLGIQWINCIERPLMTIEKPDKNYWKYIVLIFCFGHYQKAIQIRLVKAPYKNKADYITWVKAKRNQTVK
jgi:hypothetical protein